MNNSARRCQVAYVLTATLTLAVVAWMAIIGEYGVCVLVIVAVSAYVAYRRVHR